MKFSWKTALKASASLLFAGAVSVGLFGAFNGSTTADAAEQTDVLGTKRYVITSPYKDVDWDNWQGYKGATHVHTNISDGDIDFADMIEQYYSLGYDCLAITDHGTVNYGWTDSKSRIAIFGYQLVVHGSPDPLSSSRNSQITSGYGRNGRPMIDVPYGIELNGASATKTHINGFFADAGHGDSEIAASGVSGCVTAVKKNHKAGGITHINHVGEFMSANDHDTLQSCINDVYTASWINEFASDVFMSYSSCTGLELVNTADSRTRWDRYLYDELLKRLAPNGRMIWGYCEDDAHDFGDCDRNAQIFWMPSNTAANVRRCMETGAFFASSKNSRTELTGIAVSASLPYPEVTRITVDDQKSQITFEVKNAQNAYIVANGTTAEAVSCTEEGDIVTFDLNKYENLIGSYVRVYFTGLGGVTYVQPFHVSTAPYGTEAKVNFNVTFNGESVTDANIVLKNSAGAMIPIVNNTVTITLADTYTYEVTSKGTATTTGSFNINEFDLAYEIDYDIDVDIEEIPEISFIEGAPCIPHEDSKIIDGLTVGQGATGEYAVSTSSLGTIEIVPTKNGYGTGSKLNLICDGNIVDSYTFVIYGDTDGDAVIDATDAAALQMFFINAFSSEWSEAIISSFDVNNDGIFDANDVLLLRRIGMLEEIEIEQNR